MEDIGMHPDYRTGPELLDAEYVYTDDGPALCPFCGTEFWNYLLDLYPFLDTKHPNDLDANTKRFECSCGRTVTARPIMTTTFELEVVG